MTETTGDNTGEPEGDGDGPFVLAPKALPKVVSERITAVREADGALREPKIALAEPGDRFRIMEKAHDGRGQDSYGNPG